MATDLLDRAHPAQQASVRQIVADTAQTIQCSECVIHHVENAQQLPTICPFDPAGRACPYRQQ